MRQRRKSGKFIDESSELKEKTEKAVTFCMTTQKAKQKSKVQGMQRGRRKGKRSRA